MKKPAYRQFLAITPGHPQGIGPEVVMKGLEKDFKLLQEGPPLAILGDLGPFNEWFNSSKQKKRFELHRIKAEDFFKQPVLLEKGKLRRSSSKPVLYFLDVQNTSTLQSYCQLLDPSQLTSRSRVSTPGFISGAAVDLACLGILRGFFSGMVTGPIDKYELKKGGYPYDGHTDLLQEVSSRFFKEKQPVTMMLASPHMRVSLVTTHIPLHQVSSSLSSAKISQTITNTISGLKDLFGLSKPRIAVLGLNPHGSDRGLYGHEEQKIIAPVIRTFQKCSQNGRLYSIQGPFPPDGFFAQYRSRFYKEFDAVIAMYHDQGLIPLKLMDFENAVNITLGLPFLRTSVDHGTAFDIAGQGLADPSSFRAALKIALKLN